MKRIEAFTLIEMLAILTVIAFVVLFIAPSFTSPHARPRADRINCVNNLKQVGLAFRTWALDHNEQYPMELSATNHGTLEYVENGPASWHFQPLSNELSTPKIMVCPSDKKRRAALDFGSGFDDRHISYFVGVDAGESNPQMFLSGDWNITNGIPRKGRFLNLTTNELAGWTGELHEHQGNVGLADGSVQKFSDSKLRDAIGNTGVATNRLLMP